MSKEDLFYNLISQGLSVKQAIAKSGYIPNTAELAKLNATEAKALSAPPPALLSPQTKPAPAFDPLSAVKAPAPAPVKQAPLTEAPKVGAGNTQFIDGVPALLSPLSKNSSDAPPPTIDKLLTDAGLPATVDPLDIYTDENRQLAQQYLTALENAKKSLLTGNLATPQQVQTIKEIEDALVGLQKPIMVPANPPGGSFSEHYEAMGEAMAQGKEPAVEAADRTASVIEEKKLEIAEVGDKVAEGTATPEEKKDWKDKLKVLVKDYGVPVLEVIQAGIYGYTGNTAPKAYEQRLEREASKADKDFMAKLEEDKRKYEEAQQVKQNTYAAEQDRLAQEAETARQTSQLKAQKEIAQMQIGARAPTAPASVGSYVAGGM